MLLDEGLDFGLINHDVLDLVQARVYAVDFLFQDFFLCLFSQVRVFGQ